MDVITESAVTHSPSEQSAQGKVEKKSGKRIGYYYIILKSLKESQKNDVVKCLYIKGLFNFGFCVIKEGSYGDTKDKHGRDIKDRLVWQEQLHKGLQGKLRLPKLLGSFEENGNYYLVMKYVRGKNLYDKLKKNREVLHIALQHGGKIGVQFLDYLEQIAGQLETLHQLQYVHRDVTIGNFIITPRNHVYVIDMELSYSLTGIPSPPFQWGTFGYMSPNQKSRKTPVIEDDIFSIGAIISQVLSGVHPLKLIDSDVTILSNRIQFFIRDQKMADLVLQCLQPEGDQRPSTQTIRQALCDYKNDLKKRKRRMESACPTAFKREEITVAIQEFITTLASPLLTDEEKGWFAEDVHNRDNNDENTVQKAWYASFSVGASGIIYLLSRAHYAGINVEQALPFLHKGLELIEERYVSRIDTASPSLYNGAAGIAVSLASAMQHGLLVVNDMYINRIHQFLQINNSEINFENGLSGQGMAYFSCNHFIASDILQQHLEKYVNTLISEQQPDGSWLRKEVDGNKKPRKTKVFATGIAGIIYFLLEYNSRYNHWQAREAASRGLNWLIQNAVRMGHNIHWTSNSGEKLGYGYLEGNAGIALVFLKAYRTLGIDVYKDYSKRALSSIDPGLMDDNLSQGYGLSGLGEVYLSAFDILQEEEWLNRAHRIIQIIMQLRRSHHEHGTYWLVRNEKQPIPNFMPGNSGVVHFLLRYCNQDKMGFPILS